MRTPDFENLAKVLRREKPARPTLFEFFLNAKLYTALSGMEPGEGRAFERLIKAFRAAGYDYATVHAGFAGQGGFPGGERARAQSISLNEGAVIHDRASFESYAWPDVDACDYSQLESAKAVLPDGMKLIVCGPGGVLENVIKLVGYDNLCYMLADDPELVRMICDAVGSRILRHYQLAVQFDAVGAVISNDDWGFKTQTMLSHADMRTLILPWHKRIVETAHAAGKFAILHSCGRLDDLMNDVIDDLRFDAKHSCEDAIEPVEKAYERLGSRIAIVGGLDLDFVCRRSPSEVKERARKMLERSATRGGYALGTGNSVPEYVPFENYFAMTSAALEP